MKAERSISEDNVNLHLQRTSS